MKSTRSNRVPRDQARHAKALGLAPVLALVASLLCALPVIAAPIDLSGRWLAEDIGGGGVIDRLQTVLEIRDDGAVSGSGGCNRFAGHAEIGDGTIRFGPIAGTKMMCPPAAMDQEMTFFAALPQAASWRIDQQTRKLTLLDAEGRALVVFASTD